jgi:hypothetical protein
MLQQPFNLTFLLRDEQFLYGQPLQISQDMLQQPFNITFLLRDEQFLDDQLL